MQTLTCDFIPHVRGWLVEAKGGWTGLMHSLHPLRWRAARLLFKHSNSVPLPL